MAFEDQIFVLIKLFIPLLLIGGCIQYILQEDGYNVNIIYFVVLLFCVLAFSFCNQSDKVEIISEKDMSVKSQFIRLFKMILNVMLCIIYFGIAVFVAAMLPIFVIKFITFNEVFLFICCIYEVICYILIIWLILWKYKNKLFFTFSEIIIKNEHILYIENSDFLLIKTNQKTLEFWVADSKRKRMKVGDIMVFKNIGGLKENIYSIITKLYYAADFAQLMSETDMQKTGYRDVDEALYFLNEEFTEKQQKKRGVIGIEFQVVR